jgi:hypothetical protein
MVIEIFPVLEGQATNIFASLKDDLTRPEKFFQKGG